MSHRLLLALSLLLPATASADAIMPFEGQCFPGSRRGISNHAEACIPITCGGGEDCGAGARCETLCVCRAEREVRSDGRVVYPEPRRVVMEVGLCDASGACAEGDAGQRQQCEPTEDTPAFDRRLHRWTGQPYTGSSGEPPSGGGDEERAAPESPSAPTETDPPEEEEAGGCAAAPGASSGAGALALLGLVLSGIRRRRR